MGEFEAALEVGEMVAAEEGFAADMGAAGDDFLFGEGAYSGVGPGGNAGVSTGSGPAWLSTWGPAAEEGISTGGTGGYRATGYAFEGAVAEGSEGTLSSFASGLARARPWLNAMAFVGGMTAAGFGVSHFSGYSPLGKGKGTRAPRPGTAGGPPAGGSWQPWDVVQSKHDAQAVKNKVYVK